MGVSNTTVEQVYIGDGSNVTFAIPFQFIPGDLASIVVYLLDAQGVRTLVSTNDYTLSPGGANPANVVFNAAPVNLQKIVVSRLLPLTQILNYINDGPFKNEDHEKGLNRLTFMIQQLALNQGFYPNINDRDTVQRQLAPLEAGKTLIVSDDLSMIVMGPTADEVANAQGYAQAAAQSALDSQGYATASQNSANASANSADEAQEAASTAAQDTADEIRDEMQGYLTDAEEAAEDAWDAAAAAQAAAAGVQWQDIVLIDNTVSPYQVTVADRSRLFLVDTTAGDVEIIMEEIANVELPFMIGAKKIVTANKVTISAADDIDGQPSVEMTDADQGKIVNADDDGSYYSTDFGPSPKKLDKPAVDSANANHKLMGSNSVPVWAHNGFKKSAFILGIGVPYSIGNEDILYFSALSAAGAVTFPTAADHVGRIITVKKVDSTFNRITLSGTGMTTNYLHTPEETATFQSVETSTGVFTWVQIARKTDGYFSATGLITSDWNNITFVNPVIMRQGANLRLITGFTFTGSPTGSSNFYIYLPAGMVQHPSTHGCYQGHGRIVDLGTRAYDGVIQIGVTSRLILFTLAAVPSNFVVYDSISNSSPFSITNGDGGQIDTGWIKITDWSE